MNNRSGDKVLSLRAIRGQSRDDSKRLVASLKSEHHSELRRLKRVKDLYEVKNKLNDELTEMTEIAWIDLEMIKQDRIEDKNLKKN